eukprot:3583892-Prymnesium_polylepis.1
MISHWSGGMVRLVLKGAPPILRTGSINEFPMNFRLACVSPTGQGIRVGLSRWDTVFPAYR